MKDAIIVLGASSKVDGSLTQKTKSRVDKAIELYNAGHAARIIFSGKYSYKLEISNRVPLSTEAQTMAAYAISRGVSRDSLFLEESSKDTVGNAFFVKTLLLEKNGWKKVAVVTSDFHIEKTKLVFDFILGPEYEIEYVSVPSDITREEIAEWNKRQAPIIEAMKKVMESIRPGDTDSIQKAIMSVHLAYSRGE